MRYLHNPNKQSGKKHIWDESKNDTYCTLYSTGGMIQDKYELDGAEGKKLCKMCQNVALRESQTNDNGLWTTTFTQNMTMKPSW